MKYSPQLDGLRGAAILCVMIYHAGAPFLSGGFIGVDIFFVLSGYLITSLLVHEFDEAGSIRLKDFYARRVLRLMPALLALLVVFCVASRLFLAWPKAHGNYVDSLITFLYLTNWANAFSRHQPDYLGHTWSLSNEEQFYIFWPIVLWLLLRTTKNRWHVAAAAGLITLCSWTLRIYLTARGATAERIYNGLDTRADALMVGCALGVVLASDLINEEGKRRLREVLFFTTPLAAVGLAAFFYLGVWRDSWMYNFGFFAVELLVAALILEIQVNLAGGLTRALRQPALVRVGSLSYGLYLWHYPIFRTMMAMHLHWWTISSVGSLLSFAVAIVSYYAMERPILKFKRRFTRPRPVAAPAYAVAAH